jgi:hypothetical protein
MAASPLEQLPAENGRKQLPFYRHIIQEFSASPSLTKFSIIADVFSVLGLSVISLITLPLLTEFLGREFSWFDFVFTILFYIIIVTFSLSIIIVLIRESVDKIRSRDAITGFAFLIFLLIIAVIGIALVPIIHNAFGSAFNVSYMLPRPAKSAISGHGDIAISHPYDDNGEQTTTRFLISGSLMIDPGAEATNYRVIVYTRTFDETQFSLQNTRDYSGSPVIADVLEDGSFELPAIRLPRDKQAADAFIAVVRDADSWRDGWKGYPRAVNLMKDREILQMRPYLIPIESGLFPAVSHR